MKEANISDNENIEKIQSQQDYYLDFCRDKNDKTKDIYIEKNNMIKPMAYVIPEKYLKYFDNKPKMKEKMARIAHYILSDNEEERITSNYSKLSESLKKVAYMNINKMGGSAQADNENIKNYYNSFKGNIQKEIEILKPDILILMGIDEEIKEDIKKSFNGRIIKINHPAVRGKNLNLDSNEKNCFYKYIKERYAKEEEWADFIENYKTDNENVFNARENGPYLRFCKTTLEYLIKFIYQYDNK